MAEPPLEPVSESASRKIGYVPPFEVFFRDLHFFEKPEEFKEVFSAYMEDLVGEVRELGITKVYLEGLCKGDDVGAYMKANPEDPKIQLAARLRKEGVEVAPLDDKEKYEPVAKVVKSIYQTIIVEHGEMDIGEENTPAFDARRDHVKEMLDTSLQDGESALVISDMFYLFETPEGIEELTLPSAAFFQDYFKQKEEKSTRKLIKGEVRDILRWEKDIDVELMKEAGLAKEAELFTGILDEAREIIDSGPYDFKTSRRLTMLFMTVSDTVLDAIKGNEAYYDLWLEKTGKAVEAYKESFEKIESELSDWEKECWEEEEDGNLEAAEVIKDYIARIRSMLKSDSMTYKQRSDKSWKMLHELIDKSYSTKKEHRETAAKRREEMARKSVEYLDKKYGIINKELIQRLDAIGEKMKKEEERMEEQGQKDDFSRRITRKDDHDDPLNKHMD